MTDPRDDTPSPTIRRDPTAGRQVPDGSSGGVAGEQRTPLHDEHVALGAALVDFAGWQMPLRYASELAEHRAVRQAAGLFDLSHMGEIAVRGPQAGRALDLALVGSLSTLEVGRARYTMMCADDGGVLDDLVVYRTGEQAWLVVANAANADVVLTELSLRCQDLEIEIADDSDMALVAVQGPAAEAVLTSVVPDDAERAAVTGLRYYACTTAGVAGTTTLVARTGYTGEDGFEVFCRPEEAPGVWRALLAAGAPHGLVPAGLAARDSLRLEAGMPLYGQELDRTTTPYDAGLGRVVRFGKTDDDGAPLPFVGRAALAARAEAPAERVLVGLAGTGRRAARPGYAVLRGDETVGQVTSGAPSPTLGHPVAMAYIRPDAAAEGAGLDVDVRGRTEPVRVVPLPFYRRTR